MALRYSRADLKTKSPDLHRATLYCIYSVFLLVVRAGCTGGTRRTGGTAVGTATTVGRRYCTGDHCSTGCRGLRSRYTTAYIGRRSKRRFSCGSPVAQHRQQGNCHHFLHINSFLTFDLLKTGRC